MGKILTHQKQDRIVPWNLVAYVFFAWLFAMIGLALLQILLGTNGVTVYPAGEDYTWMRFVQPNKDFSLMHSWWTLASRNPLAPWWYWGISPIILKYPEGLYIARKVVELFLGISTLLIMYECLNRRRTWVALWTALLVLAWNFSLYIEQVLFVMLISLVFTLFSIYFYLVYLHSNRKLNGYLIASLIAFFIALSTYSIQCGTPIAVAIIGLLDARKRTNNTERKIAIKNTILETFSYITFFILFTQIWITTSGPTSNFFVLNVSLFIENFIKSLQTFAWRDDVTKLFHSIMVNWNIFSIVAVTLLSILIFSMLSFFRQLRIQDVKNEPRNYNILLPFIILLALSIPTILLESTSNMWGPGSRSEMLQEVFNPITYVCVFLLLIQLLERFINSKITKLLTSLFMISVCSIVTILSLEYNRLLFTQSQFGRHVAKGIKNFVPELTSPIAVLVKVKNFDWYNGRNPAITNLFIQYVYNDYIINLETVGDTSSVTSKDPLIFGSEKQGVYFPSLKRYIPYNKLLVVEADPEKISAITKLSPDLFPKNTVIFSDQKQIQINPNQFLAHTACPTRFDFNITPKGKGWSAPETNSAGEPFIWMDAPEANLRLKTKCNGTVNLSFKTFASLEPDVLNSLQVIVGGQVLTLRKTVDTNGGTIFSTRLPVNSIDTDGNIELSLKVNRTIVPEGGNRALAVPFSWIELTQS